jgi:hypothetical protein
MRLITILMEYNKKRFHTSIHYTKYATVLPDVSLYQWNTILPSVIITYEEHNAFKIQRQFNLFNEGASTKYLMYSCTWESTKYITSATDHLFLRADNIFYQCMENKCIFQWPGHKNNGETMSYFTSVSLCFHIRMSKQIQVWLFSRNRFL